MIRAGDGKLDEAEFNVLINDIFSHMQKIAADRHLTFTLSLPIWADVINKYDVDKDNKLNEPEFEAWQADWRKLVRQLWAGMAANGLADTANSEAIETQTDTEAN